MTIFKKIGKGVKGFVYDRPKNYVTQSVRRKVIASVIAAIAAILLVYGYELPADLQDSLTAVIDGLITVFGE